jgi:energy-coupling factor transporter ATP-binding protein EcfA2
MPSRLRVVSISVRDVLGAREFALEPGQVTVLQGRNGSGKSTALGAVQAALGGGSLARLARVDPGGGETEPEVVLVLEGAGSEAYRVERSGDRVRVRARVGDTAGFEDVARPQAWLSALFDAPCSNPVRFLTAADKERALLLLEALPLAFDRAALLAEMGVQADELPPIPPGLHALEELSLIRDAVFRARTGVNRDAKGKAAAAEQTRRNAPAALPEDVSAQIAQGEAAKAALAAEVAREEALAEGAERAAVQAGEAAHQLAEERVTGEFKADAAKLRRAFDQQAAEIRAAAERQVAELLATTEAAIADLKQRGEAELDSSAARLAAVREEARRELAAARAVTDSRRRDLQAACERLAALRAQADAAAKARALYDQAAQFDAEAAQLEAESGRLSAALEGLDAHRRRMAQDLPIPGLSIEDRVIRVNGIPYEQLNSAQRVRIAVQVATLRAKGQRLPVVFVDGAEALDREHFEALVAELKAAGVQAFLAKVTDEDLRTEVA